MQAGRKSAQDQRRRPMKHAAGARIQNGSSLPASVVTAPITQAINGGLE